jgi:uncharacterized protein YegL
MNQTSSDVTLVVDRSGSMMSCKDEATGGVNAFIDDQKKHDGDCLFTLVQFDTAYDFVHTGVPINDVPKFELVPRGMTALLDAVGQAINETGERLSKTAEDKRPGLVVFVIVTDGKENSSHEFTKAQIKEMIKRQQEQYNWQFTFLGANQDAFAEAQSMGIAAGAAANYEPEQVTSGFVGASANVKRMRHASARGQHVNCSYTDDERKAMTSKE